MKLLSWNCQGIGNLVTVRAFKKLISLYHPDFIFLMETKKLKKQCSFLSYVGAQYESCSTAGWGKSGGLIFLWNPIFKVEIKMHDFFYIDALITSFMVFLNIKTSFLLVILFLTSLLMIIIQTG
jgi:exonuclease III